MGQNLSRDSSPVGVLSEQTDKYMKSQSDFSKETGISLSLLVALWTAAAIAIAMGAYAVYQHFQLPETTLKNLFVHHLWHVLVLGVVIYVACWSAFRQFLLKPLNRIYVHLYGLGSGKMRKLDLHSSVRELQTIVHGINLMIWRLNQWMDADALTQTHARINEIKTISEQLRIENRTVADHLQDQAVGLEKSILAVMEARERVSQEFPEQEVSPKEVDAQ